MTPVGLEDIDQLQSMTTQKRVVFLYDQLLGVKQIFNVVFELDFNSASKTTP